MNERQNISVREIQLKDIELIVNYWLESDDDFLVSMGVDLNKLPSRNYITEMLTTQINTALTNKKSYALIWELKGKRIGHCNVNQIQFGIQANMHLHLWQVENRQKGIGTALVKKSLPYFFKNLNLKELYCEPYALNPAPNKTLEKVGFTFIKNYLTIPGSLNFEQLVNQYKMTKGNYFENFQ